MSNNTDQDWQLLREYVETGSQTAFAALVERYVNLVYSTCLRETQNPVLAEDVTQVVFLILARKAPAIQPGTILSGWLYTTARFSARDALRQETRRQHYEQKAAEEMMHSLTSKEVSWQQLEPLLHDALDRLGRADRDAVMLRFFENKNLKEVAAALRISEEAAKKRVARAVAKLRRYFSRHGFAISVALLATLITENAVEAAPLHITTSIKGVVAHLATGHLASEVMATRVLSQLHSTLRSLTLAQLKSTVAAGLSLSLMLGGGVAVSHLMMARAQSNSGRTARHSNTHQDITQTAMRPVPPQPIHYSSAAKASRAASPSTAQANRIVQSPTQAWLAKVDGTHSSSQAPLLTQASLIKHPVIAQAPPRKRYAQLRPTVQRVSAVPRGNDGAASIPAGTVPEMELLLGHSAPAAALVYSPDGKVLATGGGDRSVKLWDAQSGTLLRTLPAQGSSIKALSFSPDGALLAVGTWNKEVKLWDTKSWQLRQTLPQTDRITAVAFAARGSVLMTACQDGSIRMWDIPEGDEVPTQPLMTLTDQAATTGAMALAPDGKTLATAAADHSIKLWDMQRGKVKLTLTGHSQSPTALAFAADGHSLVSGGGDGDGAIKLWDAQTGQEQATLQSAPNRVTVVALTPDGRKLFSIHGSWDCEVWDVTAKHVIAHLPAYGSMTLSPDGSTAAISSGSDIGLYDTTTGQPKRVMPGVARLKSIATSPDGKFLVGGSDDSTLKVWDTTSGALIHILTGHQAAISSVAFAPDGSLVASSSVDGAIRLWNPRQWQSVRALKAPAAEAVTALAFTPDAKLLATGDSNGALTLWDIANGEKLRTWPAHAQSVNAVAFSPDGKRFATCSGDKTAKLWDTATALKNDTPLRTFDGFNGAPTAVAFSPGPPAGAGLTLAVASFSASDGIKLYDVATGTLQRSLVGHRSQIYAVSFSHDGQLVIGAGWDGLRLWAAATGQTTGVSPVDQYIGAPSAVAVWPDGKRFATGGQDGVVRLWSLDNPEQPGVPRSLATLLPLPLPAAPAAQAGEVTQATALQAPVAPQIAAPPEYLTFTPEGYYTGSPLAEQYLRWRVGGQLWPAQAMQARFNHPALVQQALAGQKVPRPTSKP